MIVEAFADDLSRRGGGDVLVALVEGHEPVGGGRVIGIFQPDLRPAMVSGGSFNSNQPTKFRPMSTTYVPAGFSSIVDRKHGLDDAVGLDHLRRRGDLRRIENGRRLPAGIVQLDGIPAIHVQAGIVVLAAVVAERRSFAQRSDRAGADFPGGVGGGLWVVPSGSTRSSCARTSGPSWITPGWPLTYQPRPSQRAMQLSPSTR